MALVISFLPSVGVLSGLAIIFGVLLSYASRVFHVDVDERIQRVEDALPGLNCAVCGFVGCAQYAEAVAKGEAPVDACLAGGHDTALAVGKVMGVEVKKGITQKAFLICRGGNKETYKRFIYEGYKDCRMVNMVGGGDSSCQWGCLGYGTCTTVCPYDLITMNEDGLPEIDRSECTACGACVDICPRNVIALIAENETPFVACASHDKAKVVRQVCKIDAKNIIGCIGCKACIKVCPVDAIEFIEDLVIIDPIKCNKCGECVTRCPTKCILNQRPEKVSVDMQETSAEKMQVAT